MKNAKLVSALLVAVLGLSQASATAAPGKGNNGRNGAQDCGRSHDCRGNDNRIDDNHGRDNNDHGNNGRGGQGFNRPDNERGAGPSHSYYRGDRLPSNYRSRQYVVEDWRGHGLRTPPRGYHWVQTGGDYVLVAVATGVILELLLGR
jgi:Ni/Co efflux regulator RcnB